MDRAYLDAVDEAYQKHDGDQLTERETKDFVLMHCFGIVPKLIKKPVDLLKVLLSLHSRKVRLPDFLVEYLLESLTKDTTFEPWPLADILPSRESFLRFLQDEWKTFLAAQANPSQPCRVPFSHEDVRAYIDTFFLDGSLTPVEQEDVSTLPAWARTGVVHDPKADAVRRFRGLRQKFESEIPAADVSHREWQQAAQRWAELVVLRWEWDEALDDRRPHGLECVASESRRRLRPVDDEPLRLAAQPAVSPAAGHGPPDFTLSWRSSGHGRRSQRSLCSCWTALPSISGSC